MLAVRIDFERDHAAVRLILLLQVDRQRGIGAAPSSNSFQISATP
jgi:hypothetical protein